MRITKRLFKLEEGFTLIEMSLVLFIISALLMLFIPNVTGQQKSADETGDEAFKTVLQAQVDLYKMREDGDVSFAAMQTEGYLNDSQAKKAAAAYTLSADGTVIKSSP